MVLTKLFFWLESQTGLVTKNSDKLKKVSITEITALYEIGERVVDILLKNLLEDFTQVKPVALKTDFVRLKSCCGK